MPSVAQGSVSGSFRGVFDLIRQKLCVEGLTAEQLGNLPEFQTVMSNANDAVLNYEVANFIQSLTSGSNACRPRGASSSSVIQPTGSPIQQSTNSADLTQGAFTGYVASDDNAEQGEEPRENSGVLWVVAAVLVLLTGF